MISSPIKTSSIVVPAGTALRPGTATSKLAGSVFICLIATNVFQMSVNNGGEFDCIEGAVVPVDGGFTTITFYNRSASDLVITYVVGPIGIGFIPTGVIRHAQTYTKGSDYSGGFAIAPGASVTFNGYDGTAQRKQITVQNKDANGNPLEIKDGNGISLAVIPANDPPWTLETSGVITVKNPGGVAALSRVLVGETFYA